MFRFFKLFFIAVFALSLQACEKVTPENYFDQTTLNTNSLEWHPARIYRQMISRKFPPKGVEASLVVWDEASKKMVPAKSYVEYFEQHVSADIGKNLEKVKELKPEDDTTKTMIELSTALFDGFYTLYSTDGKAIAQMMDDGKSAKEIDAAISELDKKLQALEPEYKKLLAVAVPYARSHGMKVNEH